jgi:hypothetical protein
MAAIPTPVEAPVAGCSRADQRVPRMALGCAVNVPFGLIAPSDHASHGIYMGADLSEGGRFIANGVYEGYLDEELDHKQSQAAARRGR